MTEEVTRTKSSTKLSLEKIILKESKSEILKYAKLWLTLLMIGEVMGTQRNK